MEGGQPIVTNDRYVTTIEIQEKYSSRTITLDMFVEIGKSPTIKDYKDLFKESLGVETDIKDINTLTRFDKERYYLMDFRIVEGASQDMRGIKVLRTSKDLTYTRVTKI